MLALDLSLPWLPGGLGQGGRRAANLGLPFCKRCLQACTAARDYSGGQVRILIWVKQTSHPQCGIMLQ